MALLEVLVAHLEHCLTVVFQVLACLVGCGFSVAEVSLFNVVLIRLVFLVLLDIGFNPG